MFKTLLCLFMATSIFASGPKPQRLPEAEVDPFEEAELEYLAEQASSVEELERKLRVRIDETVAAKSHEVEKLKHGLDAVKNPENRKAIADWMEKAKANPYRNVRPAFPQLKEAAKQKARAWARRCGKYLTLAALVLPAATYAGKHAFESHRASQAAAQTSIYAKPTSPELTEVLKQAEITYGSQPSPQKNVLLITYLELNLAKATPRDAAAILANIAPNVRRLNRKFFVSAENDPSADYRYALAIYFQHHSAKLSPLHAVQLAEIHHDAMTLSHSYVSLESENLDNKDFAYLRSKMLSWLAHDPSGVEESIKYLDETLDRAIERSIPHDQGL